MRNQLIGLVLIIAAGGLVWLSMNPEGLPLPSVSTNSKPLSFSAFVSEDLMHMRQKKMLPAAWGSIQYVAYNFNSDYQQALINNEKIKITESPSGRYRLEIEFIDVPDDEHPALILQYSLFELASNNKIWELGKTYPLEPFLKKNPVSKSAASEVKKEAKNDASQTQIPKSSENPAANAPAEK